MTIFAVSSIYGLRDQRAQLSKHYTMQTHLLIGLVALTSVTAAVAAPAPQPVKAAMLNFMKSTSPHTHEGRSMTPLLGIRSGYAAPFREAADNTPIWCAGSREVFYWEDGWMSIEQYTDTYTATGLVEIEECTDLMDGTMSRETNTYNTNGMLSRRLTQFGEEGSSELENSQLVERDYDSRLTDVITKNDNWFWVDGEWTQIGNNYRRIIERDDAGNITSVAIATLYNGEFDPSQRLVVTYGDNGEATSLVEEVLTYDDAGQLVWEVAESMTNIVWENTDGQIYDMDKLFEGTNRLKSATMMIEGIEANASVEYMEGGEGYVISMTAVLEDVMEIVMKGQVDLLDASGYGKGSYRNTFTTTINFGGTPVGSETETETVIYDDYGIELLIELTLNDGNETLVMDRMTNTVSYDSVYGYPLVAEATMYDPEAEEDYLYMKCVYSDYVNAVEQSEVELLPDAVAGDAEYYTLQGIRVDRSNLTPGIYIRRQGTEARKVMLRN